jgi:hypothetical protein
VEHLAHQRRHLRVAMATRPSRTRSSPCSPATPRSRQQRRQWLMVGTLTPERAAIVWLDTPSADINTIRARRASECGKLRERAIEPNCSLSAALTVTTVLGLPIGQYHTGLAS